MLRYLQELLARRPRSRPVRRAAAFEVLHLETEADTIYAVGDVHGCLDLLRALEQLLIEDATRRPGSKWFVMLGDYVDRGLQSAGVLDHLMAPLPAGIQRICIAGNHEVAMLRYLEQPSPNSPWLGFGGAETLQSYGISAASLEAAARSRSALRDLVHSHVPVEHIDFLARLPLLFTTPSYAFTHAGLRTGIAIEQQHPDDLLWIRNEPAVGYSEFAKTVVHGHTPTIDVVFGDHRISVDTGAYLSGRLSAVRLSRENQPQSFSVQARILGSGLTT
ncbi:MAG: Metallophosphoesterase [Devosia sp.]|jgi:serine/threonine protein phosphatase 1|nr:Metallophosphoesterase [Devosia sp.]